MLATRFVGEGLVVEAAALVLGAQVPVHVDRAPASARSVRSCMGCGRERLTGLWRPQSYHKATMSMLWLVKGWGGVRPHGLGFVRRRDRLECSDSEGQERLGDGMR